MTITIELPDNLEAALKAQANANGVSEASYVRSILERNLAEAEDTSSAPFTTVRGSFGNYGRARSADEIAANRADIFADAAEKARAFEAWARSQPNTPPLSDDAIRRENLVRDA